MRTIAHISDLHFGREDPPVVAGLREELRGLRPSLIVVSGDLTQRARRRQFAAAADFLASLGGPVLAVPGNHDIPLFDLFTRLLSPLGRYRRFIAGDLSPFHRDAELAVLGINSARWYRFAEGQISHTQIDSIRERFAAVEPGALRVLVSHHPFVPAPCDGETVLVHRGPEALRAAEQAGVDLILTGHLHAARVADVRDSHPSLRRAMLVAQAGTSVSRRRRPEANTYNLVSVDGPRLVVETRIWTGAAFACRDSLGYERREDGWAKVTQPPAAASPS